MSNKDVHTGRDLHVFQVFRPPTIFFSQNFREYEQIKELPPSANTGSMVCLVVARTIQACCTPATLGACNDYIQNEGGRCSKEYWFRTLKMTCMTHQPMRLKQLRKCRTLVPTIHTQYMYMCMGCIFKCIYVCYT